MDINDLTIRQAKELNAIFTTSPCNSSKSKLIGQQVVVRTYSAGVHVGVLEEKDGTNVLLSKSRRIWKWTDAFTLSEVAINGVGSGSRTSCEVELIELTQAIEILPATDKCVSSVEKNAE